MGRFERSDRLDRLRRPLEDDNRGPILSIDEIESQHPSEWVLIDEPLLDPTSQLSGGRVVCHSPTRDQVYRRAVELGLPHFAIRYFESMPDNTALVL